MKITVVAATPSHEIRFHEFVAVNGRTITSFFQIVEKPDIGIGCFDKYEDAYELMSNPPVRTKSLVEDACLLLHKNIALTEELGS